MLLHFFHFFFHPPFPLLFKRHDLPTDRNETGIMFTKPMTDVRAFHVFSRGSALVPYLELKSTAPIAFYNAATIPMVFVVYNFGATVSGSTGNVVIDEKKKSSAMGHHDLADDEDLLELGWDFLGQVSDKNSLPPPPQRRVSTLKLI